MLEKMGWKKGEGLGKEGTGMKDPVRQRGDVRLADSVLTKMQNAATKWFDASLYPFPHRLN